jgi:hypothetical protein
LVLLPLRSLLCDVRAILLGGMRRLFLKDSFRRCSAAPTADRQQLTLSR